VVGDVVEFEDVEDVAGVEYVEGVVEGVVESVVARVEDVEGVGDVEDVEDVEGVVKTDAVGESVVGDVDSGGSEGKAIHSKDQLLVNHQNFGKIPLQALETKLVLETYQSLLAKAQESRTHENKSDPFGHAQDLCSFSYLEIPF